jgi:cytochrome c oxidase subunit 2
VTRPIRGGPSGLRTVILVGALLALAGCGDLGLPEPASRQAEDTASLWRVALIAAVVIGAITLGLILWAAVRYRRRDDRLPDQRDSHLVLEVVCTVVPVVIVAGLFAYTVNTERKVTKLSDTPDLVVDVVGYQWGWTFTYPDGLTSAPGPEGEPAVLAVPVGATVRFNLRSPDVIHSFWVPEFLEKRDVIPGVDNAIDVSIIRTGTWTGRCAEFCGLDHWRMNFEVRALPQDQFEAWLTAPRTEAGT